VRNVRRRDRQQTDPVDRHGEVETVEKTYQNQQYIAFAKVLAAFAKILIGLVYLDHIVK
jgi:hypothetical protein